MATSTHIPHGSREQVIPESIRRIWRTPEGRAGSVIAGLAAVAILTQASRVIPNLDRPTHEQVEAKKIHEAMAGLFSKVLTSGGAEVVGEGGMTMSANRSHVEIVRTNLGKPGKSPVPLNFRRPNPFSKELGTITTQVGDPSDKDKERGNAVGVQSNTHYLLSVNGERFIGAILPDADSKKLPTTPEELADQVDFFAVDRALKPSTRYDVDVDVIYDQEAEPTEISVDPNLGIMADGQPFGTFSYIQPEE